MNEQQRYDRFITRHTRIQPPMSNTFWSDNKHRYEYTRPDFDPTAKPIEYTDEELDAKNDAEYWAAISEQEIDHLNHAIAKAKQTDDWDYVEYLVDGDDAILDAYKGLRGRRLTAAMEDDRNEYISRMTPEQRTEYYAELERRANLTPEEQAAEMQANLDAVADLLESDDPFDLDLDAPF